MSKSSQKPREVREGDSVRRTHPAFGMIGAARYTTRGATMFGSPIRHNAGVSITVHTAVENLMLHGEWHHAQDILVQVNLSEAQWASFVSTLNVGSGVPCTIDYRRGGELQQAPGIDDESFTEKREADIERSVARDMEKLTEAYQALVKLSKKQSIAKRDLEPILTLMIQAVGHAPGNYAFAAKRVTEHTEAAVTAAKAEITSFVTQMAMRFPQIAETAPQLQIEEKKQ